MKRGLLLTLITLTLLPPIAVASASYAVFIGSASEAIDVATSLADKGIASWFLALAIVAIASWTWIFRWMVTQLEKQRAANAKLVDQLFDYHRSDSESLRKLLERSLGVLEKLEARL